MPKTPSIAAYYERDGKPISAPMIYCPVTLKRIAVCGCEDCTRLRKSDA